jgi:hypothetical protein
LREAVIAWLDAKRSTEDADIVLLPSIDDDAVVSGPLLERMLKKMGISEEEWQRAGDV